MATANAPRRADVRLTVHFDDNLVPNVSAAADALLALLAPPRRTVVAAPPDPDDEPERDEADEAT